MAANSVNGLRHELEQDGCGFGRVTEEKVRGLSESVLRLEREIGKVDGKLNYVLGVVGIQLLSFLLAVVIFLLYHLGGK